MTCTRCADSPLHRAGKIELVPLNSTLADSDWVDCPECGGTQKKQDPTYPNDRSRHGSLVHDATSSGRFVKITAYLEAGERPIVREILCRTQEQATEVARVLRMATTNMDPEIAARTFAIERHGDQKYGTKPYVFHLAAVRQVLVDFGYSGELLVAAWLHDVLEDTSTTREEIVQHFGADVASLVWAVTGIGANRKQRNASMYEKASQNPRAIILKLADRIANVEASRSGPMANAGVHAMYKEEQETFARELDADGYVLLLRRLHAGFSP